MCGQLVSIDAISGPAAGQGTLVEQSDGTLSYTAPAGYTGIITFSYTIVDPGGQTDTGEVAVLVDVTVGLTITDVSCQVWNS